MVSVVSSTFSSPFPTGNSKDVICGSHILCSVLPPLLPVSSSPGWYWRLFGCYGGAGHSEMQEQKVKNAAVVIDLKPPPAEKLPIDRMSTNRSLKRMKSPITATSYIVASLQMATNIFSQEYLIGEGSLGRVYNQMERKRRSRRSKETLKAKDVVVQEVPKISSKDCYYGWFRSFIVDYGVPLMVVVRTTLYVSVPGKVPSGVPRRLFSPLPWESASLDHWTVIKVQALDDFFSMLLNVSVNGYGGRSLFYGVCRLVLSLNLVAVAASSKSTEH
ncbi:Bicarbonate transporter, eukaryotic [Corchorus capsularis]|uniref:Bicarbonate transporter, eukaryotic n=1 Tax=Corchorus capsularis TaxID=210143 RepID=A0A1R3IVE3_COCAP|nr:Bicarbonate transporter, eukaryotic [Corchorus capsularis]